MNEQTMMSTRSEEASQQNEADSSSAVAIVTFFEQDTIKKRLNGEGSSRISNLQQNADEMLESEKSSLAGRVHDLERRVLTQQDEIVCLRSTLADVLRRLTMIESGYNNRSGIGGNIQGGSSNSNSNSSGSTSGGGGGGNVQNSNSSGGRSAPSTPQRNGGIPNFSRLTSSSPTSSMNSSSGGGINNNNSNVSIIGGEWKLRKPNPIRSAAASTAESVVRRHTANINYNANANLNQSRSKSIHYSNGSLHSDSPSSSSVSPAPSPSPRPATVHITCPVGTGLSKRWNSTGDFAMASPLPGRFTTKSLLNLTTKPALSGHILKHGTHTTTFNDEESTVRMFLRGRPIVLHVPSTTRDLYDVSKVEPAPSRKLKMDWVYGYRGKDCRSNLYQLPTGEMVYFVAAAVVLYNADEQSQRHYLGHTDDVKSLAIHPNKMLVATGQCAGHDRRDALPHIRVWNSVSLTTMAIIGNGDFTGSVTCLSFSRADSGALLVAIDDAPEKVISVWEWQKSEKGHRITETKCSVDTVVAAEFHPVERNQIVSAGKNHIAFWTLDAGGALYKKMGIFEGRDKPKYVTCIAFTAAGDTITGDSNGNIIVWGRGTNTIVQFLRKVHDGAIFSLCSLKDGALISGGGKDGRLVLFDSGLNQTGTECLVEPHFGAVRIISEGKGSQLLIGTTRNCILIGAMDLGLNPVVMGHTEELWGLAAHPNMAQFVTGGRDRLLQLWDSLSHSVVWSKDIGEQIQSCAFSPDGDAIAVGSTSGRWLVFDTVSRELIAQHSDGQEAIQAIRFSPDGAFLALGSRDNAIYVYQMNASTKRFAKVGKCTGHSSFITHIDWSADGQVLRSNSGDYELLFWNSGTCRQIVTSSTLADTQWATHTCALTFQTIGIWPETADGTDINSCARSNDQKLVVSGDDWGKVRLYNYPAAQPKCLAHIYGGHSSHVTAVSFLHDDTRIISTGGNDTSVIQWTIV